MRTLLTVLRVVFGMFAHVTWLPAADATSFDPTPIPVVSQGISGVPVGTVIAWPSSALPRAANGVIPSQTACVAAVSDEQAEALGCEWLEADGSILNPTAYAELSAVAGPQLPDYRGEFLRGWDHGRGVDAGRAIRTAQADEFKRHSHPFTGRVSEDGDEANHGPTRYPVVGNDNVYSETRDFTSQQGGDETRPRNVAVMYLVRAR